MQRSVVRITRRQALAIAELLQEAPATATYCLEQVVTDHGHSHTYLHDRMLPDPCVRISAKGSVSHRMDSTVPYHEGCRWRGGICDCPVNQCEMHRRLELVKKDTDTNTDGD